MCCSAPAKFIMSKIGFLQNCLEDIFVEYTLQFVNKMHWIQLQCRVEKKQENISFCEDFLEKWGKGSNEECDVCML